MELKFCSTQTTHMAVCLDRGPWKVGKVSAQQNVWVTAHRIFNTVSISVEGFILKFSLSNWPKIGPKLAVYPVKCQLS